MAFTRSLTHFVMSALVRLFIWLFFLVLDDLFRRFLSQFYFMNGIFHEEIKRYPKQVVT